MSLIYEVNIAVREDMAQAHAAWLRAHVRQILAVPGFIAADILDVLEPAAEDGWVLRSVRYMVRDRAALDAYFQGPAVALRADGVAQFGDAARYERRVLRVDALIG